VLWAAPITLAQAQSSPFMTGATALETNILAWLTPIAMHLKMERRGLESGLAERLRAEYRARVASRLENSAVPDEATRRTGQTPPPKATAAAVVGNADMEEVRRRAREAWLQLRTNEQQAQRAGSATPESEREAREQEATPARPSRDDLAL
jgi:hypothetical protein